MSKERIAVIFGGQSPEHEVSIGSARTALHHLNPSRYDIVPIYVTREGEWAIPAAIPDEDSYAKTVRQLMARLGAAVDTHAPLQTRYGRPAPPPPATLQQLRALGVTLCLILIHGQGGEDGITQRALEDAGIAYIGTGPKACEVTMDKRRTLDVLAAAGLNTPQGCVFQRGEDGAWRNEKRPDAALAPGEAAGDVRFLPPWVVKPNCGGSSVGVTIVNDPALLDEALVAAAEMDDRIIVETCLAGAEVTCGVIERWDGEAGRLVKVALPPTRIIPRHAAFFDYTSKYTAGETMEITPANLEPETIERIREAALLAHTALGCRGLSRTDMIVQDGAPFVLEVNTLPGMTQTSLLPQGAAAAGIEFSDLLDIMIQAALFEGAATRRFFRAPSAAPTAL